MSWTDLPYFVEELGRTTLAVGVLMLLVLLIRKPFARRFGAKAAYALWLVPLTRFVVPPLPASWSLSGWLGFAPANVADTPNPVVITPDIAAAVYVPAETSTAILPAPPLPAVAPQSAPDPSLIDAIFAQGPLLVVVIWIAGSVLWLSKSFYQQRVFRQLIDADSEAASGELQAQAAKIAAELGLKRVPDVRASLLCSGPLVTGLVRPVVLLPLWFEDDYTADERRDALVHELTHLRRHDLWAFQAARIVAATQWFNPLVHMALQAFRTDQESACDADVLRQTTISPAAYGRTLVKAARLARPSDRRIAAASLTLAHPIKERLIMMQHPTPTLRSRLFGTALASAFGAAAIFTTASCMTAQAEDKSVQTFVFDSSDFSDNGHQIVLLGDPFSDLHPKLEALSEMEVPSFAMELELNMAELGELEALGELAELDVFGNMGHILAFSTEDGAENVFLMKSGETSEEFEARIEAWAEELGTRAEVWAELMEVQAEAIEQRAEAFAIRIEARAEAMEAAHEAKANAWAQDFELQFDGEFEDNIEGAASAVQSLTEQCEARDENDPTPEIVTATNDATGETHRALCLNASHETLQDEALKNWVESRSDLSEAEKAAFLENRGHVNTIKIQIDRDKGDTHRVIERSSTELEGSSEE